MNPINEDSKKKMSKNSKEFVPKTKTIQNVSTDVTESKGENEGSNQSYQNSYPYDEQLNEAYLYYYNQGYTEEEAYRLAYEYIGVSPDNMQTYDTNKQHISNDYESTDNKEKYEHKEYEEDKSTYIKQKSYQSSSDGYYDDYGFYYLNDGSFYDPDGYYFDKDGYDETGGYYDDYGNYIAASEDKHKKQHIKEKEDIVEQMSKIEIEDKKELDDDFGEFEDKAGEEQEEEEENYSKEYIEYVLEHKYYDNLNQLKNSKHEFSYFKAGNLAENTTKHDILNYFKECNIDIRQITVIMNKNKNNPVARLEIYQKEVAFKVLKLCGSMFKGNQIIIEIDEENEKFFNGGGYEDNEHNEEVEFIDEEY